MHISLSFIINSKIQSMHCALHNDKEVLVADRFSPPKNAFYSSARLQDLFTEKRKTPVVFGFTPILHVYWAFNGGWFLSHEMWWIHYSFGNWIL